MRVIVADDEVLLREGLARLLEEAGFEVAGKAGDATELLRLVELTASARILPVVTRSLELGWVIIMSTLPAIRSACAGLPPL